jgi:hypothetical protein
VALTLFTRERGMLVMVVEFRDGRRHQRENNE